MAIKNTTLYEDNYGFYCVDNAEEEAFYIHIVRVSVAKKCVRCHQKVKLQQHIKICASCSNAIEYGASESM